jgi:hypothetical protein
MTIFNAFRNHFDTHNLQAVYFRNKNSCTELILFRQDKNKIIPIHNTQDFFKLLSKEFNIGKNAFTDQLNQLHNDGTLGKTVHILPVNGTNKSIEYVVIKNLFYYLT